MTIIDDTYVHLFYFFFYSACSKSQRFKIRIYLSFLQSIYRRTLYSSQIVLFAYFHFSYCEGDVLFLLESYGRWYDLHAVTSGLHSSHVHIPRLVCHLSRIRRRKPSNLVPHIKTRVELLVQDDWPTEEDSLQGQNAVESNFFVLYILCVHSSGFWEGSQRFNYSQSCIIYCGKR